MKYTISNISLVYVGKHFHTNGKLDGSQFNLQIFPTPESLIDYSNSNAPEKIFIQENGREAHIFSIQNKVAGHCGIDLKQNHDEKSIFLQDKNGYQIQCVNSDTLPETNEFCLIVEPLIDTFNIITMYPGEYAPPLPNSKFTAVYNEFCDDFWKERVFILT